MFYTFMFTKISDEGADLFFGNELILKIDISFAMIKLLSRTISEIICGVLPIEEDRMQFNIF